MKQYQTGHKAKQDFTCLAEPCTLQVGQRSASLRLVEPSVGQRLLGRRPFPFIAVQHGLDQRASLHLLHRNCIEIAWIFSRKNADTRANTTANVQNVTECCESVPIRSPVSALEHHASKSQCRMQKT